MIHPDLKTLAAPTERTSRIIWLAFMLGPLVYAVLAWIMTDGGERQFERGALPAAAIYVAILASAASGILFPWVIAPRFASPAKVIQNPGPRPTAFKGESARLFDRLGERDQNRARHLGAIQTARIVQWAGAESVAIYGLMAMMMGVTGMYGAWAFCLAAIGLISLLRPDFERDLEQI